MNTGAELGQYFRANTIKNIQWGLNLLTPSGLPPLGTPVL